MAKERIIVEFTACEDEKNPYLEPKNIWSVLSKKYPENIPVRIIVIYVQSQDKYFAALEKKYVGAFI